MSQAIRTWRNGAPKAVRSTSIVVVSLAAVLLPSGCSTAPDGSELIAAATQHAEAALLAREQACGQDASPLPPQSLQPRMPERDTPACREASFEYEKAMLDLGMTKHRFLKQPASGAAASQ